jgi:hypothetical protein
VKARQVHSVLAAGLQNPQLIAAWQADPQRLRQHGIEPGSVDLAALWMFAGLTVKVRHNGLREDWPLSFRLMNLVGLEIEVFTAYARSRAFKGPSYASTTQGKARDLIAFLGQWLDRTKAEHSMLWDLIRHEEALARLAGPGAPTAPERQPRLQRTPTAASIPWVCGELILHEMRCDPRAIAAALRQSRPPLDQVSLSEHRFCYWRLGADDIRIVELDAFSYYALSLVDGARSAADLSRALAGNRRPAREFLQLLGQLGDAGMLRFEGLSLAKMP